MFFVAAGAGVDGAGQKGDAADVAQAAHQQDVLHQRDIGEAAELLEDGPSQKDSLIAKPDSRAADAQRISEFDQPEAES